MLEVFLTIAAALSTVFTVILLSLPSQYNPLKADENNKIQILVLGDIGRSPRMQYHAMSIAKHGAKVEIIGYQESDLHPDISTNADISIISIPAFPARFQTSNKSLFLLYGPLKVLFQIWSLWLILGYRTTPAKWLLVQNPPTIPTLAIAQLICTLRHTRLLIDWHNFGYSILALKLGSSHPLVRASEWFERFFSRHASAHFAVTNVMADLLRKDFGLKAPVVALHDRPAKHLQPIMDEQDRLSVLARIPETRPHVDAIALNKTKLIVSSTSWTPDEDFSLLLEALADYSTLATTSHPQLPEILAIITGKGPQKEMYLSRIAALEEQGKLEMASIRTAWLTTEDYAALLASADLGISLHTSSSGVDLPMKVVDMFGAGLPVLGWSAFKAWPELVTEGINGRGFESAEGLRDLLVEVLDNTRDGGRQLPLLKKGAVKEGERRWDDEWDEVAGRVFGFVKD